ncbi:MAG: hypothetical protein EOO27_39555, partial [Comamonadaceae bacterium]
MDSMVRRRLWCLPLAMGLTGCASVVPPYAQDFQGPHAELLLRVETGGMNLGIARFRGEMNGYYCAPDAGEVIAILHNKSLFRDFADRGANVDRVS